MAKTSKTQTVILTKESQLNQLDNIGSVLIYPSKVDTKSLIKAVQDKNLVINSIVEYDPDNAYTAKNLSDQGFPNGCYLVVDVTTKVEPTKIIGNFSLALQMGYRAATILNSSDYTKEELSQFSSAQIHVINRSLIKDDCFDDPEMLTSRNVALARDYTNVDDTLTEGAYVGVNKDTSGLGGGQAFGYSTNGKNFYSVITPKGIIFRQNDADRLWRLLKLTQRSDIESTVNDSVSKEIEAQKPLIDGAKEVAQTAVDTANQAIANSRVNSEAIININSAASAAKSDAQNATNIANAMKSSVTDQLKNLDSTSKELDNARSEMTQYAKTAQDQGKDIADLKKSTAEITADVANTKGDVAELKINASATAVMASNNKSDITQLQVTASNASIDLQNAKSDIASFNATANKINTSIKDQDNRISTVEQTAKGIQATIGNQQNDINTIKQEATGMKETITNNQKQLTEINTSVDGLSTKVAGAVGKDFVESSIKQANDKINESITSINGNIQNITADLNGVQATVKNKADVSQITQLTNLISTKVNQDDYKSAITQLGDDINARVQKGDLISQINLEAGQTLIQSKKLFLDADSVVFSGKAFIPDAAIANLSLDKLTTGHLTVPIADEYGNQIEMGNSGIDLISASEPINYASSGGTSNDKSTFRLNLSSSGISFTNRIEYGDTSPHNNKFDDYQFVNLQPDILHASDGDTDMVTIPSGMTMYIPVNYSSDLGPKSPGGFFALGHEITSEANGTDRGVDIAYVTKEINGWEMGLHVRTPMHILPPGADHGIRTT
ncbi:hypothetical protein [Limosilactobacillus portuensis]|nr:hypothetical protein [Limosilactobacillus portuensis]WCT61290.1 hypothetical protein PRK60_02730 [Limosilactobacillus portuensis]